MESNLKKFSQEFYDLNVSITGMCCLGLLDSSNRNAVRTLEDMLENEDLDELNTIFGLGEGDLEEDDLDFSFILDLCKGWLVLAEVAQPRNISFNDAGEVEGYSTGGYFRPLTTYKDTLEDALAGIAAKAKEELDTIINKARKEQGLTVGGEQEEREASNE